MPLTFLDALTRAEANHVCLCHFNVSDLIALKAIFDAARERNVPVVIGVSEGERAFIGVTQVAALVASLRAHYDFPLFLNADHTHSLQGAIEAAKAGFDWVVFDRSSLPFEENVSHTREAVQAVKAIRPEILVEGEIGNIGSGSDFHDAADIPRGPLTSPLDAKDFVMETGVDTLAPAVGNMHGMLRSMVDGEARKHLDIDRIRAIKEAAPAFLTLHGASGTADEDLRSSVKAGITVVHFNTEIRLAWRRGLEQALARLPDEIVPYKVLPAAVDAVRRAVQARLSLLT